MQSILSQMSFYLNIKGIHMLAPIWIVDDKFSDIGRIATEAILQWDELDSRLYGRDLRASNSQACSRGKLMFV